MPVLEDLLYRAQPQKPFIDMYKQWLSDCPKGILH